MRETVHQLLVFEPREKKLELAHSSSWGDHLGKKKNTQSLKCWFYWPNIKKDVIELWEKCLYCQHRAKQNKFHDVPITQLTRPEEAMQIINIDIIVPTEHAIGGYK